MYPRFKLISNYQLESGSVPVLITTTVSYLNWLIRDILHHLSYYVRAPSSLTFTFGRVFRTSPQCYCHYELNELVYWEHNHIPLHQCPSRHVHYIGCGSGGSSRGFSTGNGCYFLERAFLPTTSCRSLEECAGIALCARGRFYITFTIVNDIFLDWYTFSVGRQYCHFDT